VPNSATIRQFQVFAAVARNLNFTKAAKELHLSQPAVSLQVKQLESSMGLPLTEMVGKKLFLTEAGKHVFACSQSIHETISLTIESLDSLRGLHKGKINISVATTASYFAIHLLSEFSSLYPAVDIKLDITNRESLLHKLENNLCDMVVMGEPPNKMATDSTAILKNPLVIVASPECSLAQNNKMIQLSELSALPFLVREKGSGTRAAIERFFAQQGLAFNFTMEMTSNEAIKRAAMANMGIGIASKHTLDLELQTGSLVMLNVEQFPIMRNWYMVHTQGKRLSPIAASLKKFIIDKAADFPSD
jgi:LysR family transcriptional regulator, low CO2-responsive transcriptional regulator